MSSIVSNNTIFSLQKFSVPFFFFFFFLNDTAPTEISPLPLHDALPIPRGTSLNPKNRQSVTSVSFSPRQSRTAGETSRPAPPFRLGFGRSLPKTYCQWSVRKGPASSHCAYAIRLPFRIATQRSLQVERAGHWYASLNHGTTRGASGRCPVCALSLYGSAQ